MAQSAIVPGPFQRQGVQQFVKFCVVGATSTVIDAGILWFLKFSCHWSVPPAQTLSFVVAVTNGYIWNSLWTFKGRGSGKQHEQYLKFVAVNIVGLILNLLIINGVFYALTGSSPDLRPTDKIHFGIAKAVAVVIASVWNFLASKLWTFKHNPPGAA
jgi:putative flippase GtrA